MTFFSMMVSNGTCDNHYTTNICIVYLFRSLSLSLPDITFKTFPFLQHVSGCPASKDEGVGLSRQGGGRYGRAAGKDWKRLEKRNV